MTTQPEALRLAEAIDFDNPVFLHDVNCAKAAAELRRLHAENDLLKTSQYGSGRLRALRDQRDELLAALMALHERYVLAIGNEGPEALAARAAIAKVEAGK